MSADEEFDLVIVGAGSAGLSAAKFAAAFGARTAIVEAEHVGGDCTWTGCVPSKALLQAARVAHTMRTAGAHGIGSVEPSVDLGAVMGKVRAAIGRVYENETPDRLRDAGLEVLIGQGRFVDEHAIEVGGRRLHGRRFLICTGAEPEMPPIPGLAETPHLTYLDVYDLTELPPRLVVLGGGAIGCELAQAFSRLGSEVTLVEAADHLLPATDAAAGTILAGQFAEEGVEVQVGTAVSAMTGHGGEVTVATKSGEIVADALLVATGRSPRTAGLDLETAGVTMNGRAVRVDERLRTSRTHIYAAGDVTGSFQFTHYAGWQGFQAVRNALLPGGSAGVRPSVPWAVFTDPEVAQVGVLEGEMQEWPLARIDRAMAIGERRGLLRVYLSHDGRLNGALICLESASELINELSLAIEAGIRWRDVASAIHAYPTFGIALQQLAAEDAVRQATSGIRGRIARGLVRLSP